MKSFLLPAFIWLWAFNGFGQGNRQQLDSLLVKLKVAKEDTSKALLLMTIGSLYETNNQDSAFYYLEQGKALSGRLKFTRGLYQYQNRRTILLYTKGEYRAAMNEAEKGLAIAREMNDTTAIITMLNNLGILSMYFGDYNNQLNYALQVVKGVESIHDSVSMAGAYHNLSNSYHALKQYRKGVTNAAYGIYVDSVSSTSYRYINRVYSTLAQCYEGLRMMDSAIFFYERAIAESKTVNDSYAESSIYSYMANAFASLGRFGDMMTNATKAVEISNGLQSRQLTAGTLNMLAYAQFLNGRNDEARLNISLAGKIAREDSLLEELRENYTLLSYILAGNGDYSASIEARRAADSLNEMMLNDKVLRNIAESEQKYESAKKDAQIQLQKAELFRKETWNYVLIASIAGILIVALLGYRNYRSARKLQQQRINELETEKQLEATGSVLKGEERERSRLAKDLHDGLGGMLSGIKYSLQDIKGNLVMSVSNAQAFERSLDMLDSSINEMRRVAHNMMPEALEKFGPDAALRDFCNDINRSGALQVQYQSMGKMKEYSDQTKNLAIYRIVQELLNNVMKHSGARQCLVQLSFDRNVLAITVEDDGRGFDASVTGESPGIGWRNIRNRVELLKGKWDIVSRPGQGTSVHIEFAA